MKYLFAGFATIDIIEEKLFPGGAAGSLALNATSLGISSHLLTVLSTNELGMWYQHLLENNNVSTPYSLDTAPSIPTCHIPSTEHKGSERIWTDNGSLPFFKDLNPPIEYLSSFHTIFAANAPPDLTKTLARRVTDRTVVYIPGPQIIHNNEYLVPELLEKTIILFANEEEWDVLEPLHPLNFGIPLIVVTKGNKGETIFTGDQILSFHAPTVQLVRDVTGAGDNFALHFTYAYALQKNIGKAIEAAHKAVESILQQEGTIHPDIVVPMSSVYMTKNR